MDVNLASAFAIELLLSTVSTAEKRESNKVSSATRIRILEPIGSGLDGRVYRALQVDLDRPVAVKIIKRDAPNAADAIEHAKALARVGNHPSIVTVHCVEKVLIEDHGTETAIVMELLDGEHFGNRLNGPRFTSAEVRRICEGVLDGMEHMHKSGVRHGDLHWANVILSADCRPKIIDIDVRKNCSLGQLSSHSRKGAFQADIDYCRQLIYKAFAHSELTPSIVSDVETQLGKCSTLEAFGSVVRAALS